MVLTVGSRLTINRFPEIAASLRPRVSQVQRKTAADIVAAAMMRTLRVLTGAMKAGYRFEQRGDLEWIVYNLMHYHIYHELGTVDISAMPMLVPAAEQMRGPYAQAVAAVLNRGI